MRLKITIGKKLSFICLILLIVPSLTIGLVSYNKAKNELNQSGMQDLKNQVRMTLQMINSFDEQVKSGKISLEEAQEKVKISILGPKDAQGKRPINKQIETGKNGYISVYDTKGNEVAHPTLEGQNVWDYKTNDGRYYVQEIIKKATEGGGFTQYDFNLPNSKLIAPKIVYSELDPHWGWVVAAGTYMMDFNAGASTIFRVLLISLGLALTVGIIMIYFLARHITKPLAIMAKQAELIAEGDLTGKTIETNRRDEIGQLQKSFNGMVGNLRTLITHIANLNSEVMTQSKDLNISTEQTSKASEEIAAAINQVSIGAQKTAATINEVSLGQTETANHFSDLAEHIADILAQTQEMFEHTGQGNKIIEMLSSKIEETSSQSDIVQSVMERLSEQASQINGITEIIKGIAEQTNLLALNAAIEAARAGEKGQGFAVVAEEVRKLAEAARIQSHEIANLINQVLTGVSTAVNATQKTTTLVGEEAAIGSQAQKYFIKITEEAETITHLTKNVKNQLQRLNDQMLQVNQSIEAIHAISEENAASAEEIAASTEQVSAANQTINSSVQRMAQMLEKLQKEQERFML